MGDYLERNEEFLRYAEGMRRTSPVYWQCGACKRQHHIDRPECGGTGTDPQGPLARRLAEIGG